MPNQNHCIIVGGSHAAAQAAISLRREGWEGGVTLISAEPILPYQRPPLSKTFLFSGEDECELLIRPAEFYEKQQISIRTGLQVTEVDHAHSLVHCDNGEQLGFSHLILATGAEPVRLQVPGADLPGICYLRSHADVLAIRQHLKPGARVVVVGGGYIGLETAAALRQQGMQVTVLEAQPRILQRVTAPEVSEFYTRVHREEGVEILLNIGIDCFVGDESVNAVLLNDGRHLPVDLVVVGIGVRPNVALAEQLGLDTPNGVRVDEQARTALGNIYAVGDCSYHYNPIYDRWLRLESVQNAADQARTAALSVCEKVAPYNALPWFWSDQYDLKLQMAGLSAGYDEIVIRGDRQGGRSFSAFYLREGKLIAIDSVNRPKEFTLSKRFITEGRTVNKTTLADESVDFKACFE